MPALFPPWANTATTVALIAIVVGAAAVIATPMLIARSPYATGQGDPIVQPIAFDHRHHVRDEAIPCLYCHEGAERGPYAGVPPAERCLGCHAQIWSDSEQLRLLRVDAPIRWKRVHAVPDFVYFDHRAHVGSGVDCTHCHGDVGDMAAVYQVHPLTMSWCVDCHRERSAPTHCSTCHR